MSKLLPMDVITDIFTRLPLKSLVRFKSLSKSCCSLIDDPDFINSHLNCSIKTRSNLNILLKGLHLYTVEFGTLNNAVPIDYPLSNGAGQDVRTNDYKLVRMAKFNKNDDQDDDRYFYDYEVKVYSLKNDSWKKILKLLPYLRFMFQFFYHLLHRRG